MDKNDSNEDNQKKQRNDPLVWTKYMTAKREKLFNQFNENRNLDQSFENNGLNQLFSGVCVYINGVTNPSEMELKTLISNSGGMYLNHFDTKRTTHTIAQNLCIAKIKNLKDNQIVVKPEWITDSLNAKQLLPVEDYLTIKRDFNLRQYLNKPNELMGHIVEDLDQILDSNEVNGNKNDELVEELGIESRITTICEPILIEEESNGFNQNNYIPDSLSQIDPQFLEALPIELRNDILKELNIQSESNGKRKDKTELNDLNKKLATDCSKDYDFDINYLNSDQLFDEDMESDELLGGLLTSINSANICGKTNTTEIIELIEEWVSTEEELIDEDIAYVTKYFCDLIDERKYNHLIKTFTKLFDFIQKRNENIWKQTFNDIRDTIITETKNNLMQNIEEIYNLPLFVIN